MTNHDEPLSLMPVVTLPTGLPPMSICLLPPCGNSQCLGGVCLSLAHLLQRALRFADESVIERFLVHDMMVMNSPIIQRLSCEAEP